MSNILKDTNIKFAKEIEINGEIKKYYENVLKSLGLSSYYIYRNNFSYFGYENIDNQNIIFEKFKKIKSDFESFTEYLLSTYNYKILLLRLTNIYSKLQEIHLNNDFVLENINKNDKFEDISYSSKASDLMARKIKFLIEKTLMRQHNGGHSRLKKSHYKRLIILLYYYSIYIFYSVRNSFSKEYENGITKFWVDPKALSPIYTQIEGMDNSTNDNCLFYNYNSNKEQIINKEFNEAFLKERGILYVDFVNLMRALLNSLGQKNNGIISVEKLNDYILKNFPNCNVVNVNT